MGHSDHGSFDDRHGNPVPSKIKFAIPDLDADGVYLSMFVDFMNDTPKTWLRIDYDQCVCSQAIRSPIRVLRTSTSSADTM